MHSLWNLDYHIIFAIGTCFHPVYKQKTPPLSQAIFMTLSYQLICVLGIYIRLHFPCATLKMCIRHVFLCGFPFSSLNVTASSQHAEKKVMWACKIFCQHRGEKKRGNVWERKTKCFYTGQQRAPSPARCLATNHKSNWTEWQPYHDEPAAEFLLGSIRHLVKFIT